MAVAQHREPVAEPEHLLQPMGDENDRQALGLERPVMMRARLATSASLSAEVGSSMTMSRERIESARAISTNCCSATERSRTGVIGSRLSPILSVIARVILGEAPPADEQPRARFAADEHVLGDRHVGGEGEFLIDGDDAGALGVVGRGEGDRLAIELDLARIGAVRAGQNLEQRRLAGAVLAQKRMDFGLADFEMHVLERKHAGKALADPGHLEDRTV